ncbi:gluconate 2-dehydrogenase subunit 3 family protein [Mesorhizobium sp. KR1-2]|uniref:gluconate 2-dehydrogenase subunit 3 family protein n=1 Tax=Mesorhizobium sp. KR1-2 TaxID=3156609 RepID=UPI0032B498FE
MILQPQPVQSRFTPSALYRAAIKAIDAHVGGSSGKRFAELGAEEQDALLKNLGSGSSSSMGATPRPSSKSC